MQYQCGNTYISGRRTKRELPKAQTKRELMQMKHSAKEIRAKATSKANAIVKMNKNNGDIQSLAMAMSREEKCRQKEIGKQSNRRKQCGILFMQLRSSGIHREDLWLFQRQ